MLFAKLILAHLIGDFLLQTSFLVKGKEKYKLGSWHVWAHVAIHGVLVHALLQTWWITLAIVITHAIIDAMKLTMQGDGDARRWFMFDQLLHVGVIVVVTAIAEQWSIAGGMDWVEANVIWLTAVVFLTKPASWFVAVAISCWDDSERSFPAGSMHNAGAMIGTLERILVFLLTMVSAWNAIGIVLVAKALFYQRRLGPDSGSARYVVAGTLLSVLMAIGAGLITSALG